MRKKTTTAEIGITLGLFELGSSPLYLLGRSAKQDAWIALILAAIVGFFILYIHLQIHLLDSKRDLFENSIHSFGRVFGGSIAFLYSAFFIYESSRVVRDLGELVVATLLNKTPISVVMLLELIVITFVANYGPRIFFRFCGVFLYVIVSAYLIIFTLILLSGLVHIQFILPVMENGFKPIVDAVFPDLVVFPFGQTVLFLTVFKYATDHYKFKRIILLSFTLVSTLLLIINQLVLLVLGPELAELTTYPLYTVVQLIQAAHTIERTDVLFTLILFIGLVIKLSLYYIGAAIGFQKVFKIKYNIGVKFQLIPVFFISLAFPSYIQFMFGEHVFLTKYIFLVFQVLIPACLLTVMMLKRERNQIA